MTILNLLKLTSAICMGSSSYGTFLIYGMELIGIFADYGLMTMEIAFEASLAHFYSSWLYSSQQVWNFQNRDGIGPWASGDDKCVQEHSIQINSARDATANTLDATAFTASYDTAPVLTDEKHAYTHVLNSFLIHCGLGRRVWIRREL